MTEKEFEEYMDESNLELVLRFEGWNQNNCFDIFDAVNVLVGQILHIQNNSWIFVTQKAILRADELMIIAQFMRAKERGEIVQ